MGLLQVLGGVFYLLEAANGPGAGPRTFAERRSYDLVKRDLHAALPIGAPVALGGLLLAIVGQRLRQDPPEVEDEVPGD